MKMTDETLKAACELLRPPELKQLVFKLRYMGRQYGAGQMARGGGGEKHYLEEAGDELDRLFARTIELGQEVADLRNVVQAACIGGVPAMAKSWEKHFPDHPISISAEESLRAALAFGDTLLAASVKLMAALHVEQMTENCALESQADPASTILPETWDTACVAASEAVVTAWTAMHNAVGQYAHVRGLSAEEIARGSAATGGVQNTDGDQHG